MILCVHSCSKPEYSIPDWSKDSKTLLQQCEKELVSEVQTICWIHAATVLIQEDPKGDVSAACNNITEELWRDECYFRAAEELSILGRWQEGIRACRLSGRFEYDCIKHSYWREPFKNVPPNDAPLSDIKAEFEKIRSDTSVLLKGLPTATYNEGIANISAQFAHSLIVGKGRARADLAHEKGEFGAFFRTVYGIEGARILSARRELQVDAIVQSWEEKKDIVGIKSRRKSFTGRYYHNKRSKQERALSSIVSFGGYTRIQSKEPNIDITVAALEGIYSLPSASSSLFKPYINHQHPEIRLTARRLGKATRSPSHRRP